MSVNETLTSLLTEWFPAGGRYYFVEAGAHDGYGDSQTYWLEQAGWDGLCVEPSLSGTTGLSKHRKCSIDHRCLSGSDGEVLFRELTGDHRELSGIVEFFYDHWDRENRPHDDRYVEAVTLHRMLSEHAAPPSIDFLCLDTEGSEPAILKAHDFSRYEIKSAWVEYNDVKSRLALLTDIMTARGYRVALDTGHDVLFVLKS